MLLPCIGWSLAVRAITGAKVRTLTSRLKSIYMTSVNWRIGGSPSARPIGHGNRTNRYENVQLACCLKGCGPKRSQPFSTISKPCPPPTLFVRKVGAVIKLKTIFPSVHLPYLNILEDFFPATAILLSPGPGEQFPPPAANC